MFSKVIDWTIVILFLFCLVVDIINKDFTSILVDIVLVTYGINDILRSRHIRMLEKEIEELRKDKWSF